MGKRSNKSNHKFRNQDDYERVLEKREDRAAQRRRKEALKNQRATKNSQNMFFDLNDSDY